jgi:MFS family permease
MQPAPLRRNRDFVLLQAGQLVSTLGTSAASIAYPLLTLAVTQSPAKAGAVGFAALLPQPILGLVAGVVADRWDRKRLMIASDAVRAAALSLLTAAIVLDRIAFWQILVVAVVEGVASVVFLAAHPGALRAIVPARQLPDAAGVQEARAAVARVVGPTLGGALFGLGRAIPFLADAASHVVSIAAIAAMRATGEPPSPPPCSAGAVAGRVAVMRE